MTKKELIKALEPFDDYNVVVLSDSRGGWCNIEEVIQDGIIHIKMEETPIFSEG